MDFYNLLPGLSYEFKVTLTNPTTTILTSPNPNLGLSQLVAFNEVGDSPLSIKSNGFTVNQVTLTLVASSWP